MGEFGKAFSKWVFSKSYGFNNCWMQMIQKVMVLIIAECKWAVWKGWERLVMVVKMCGFNNECLISTFQNLCLSCILPKRT